jgi:hypothetical protein
VSIYCSLRAGIADGGEFYIRPQEPLPGFLIKLNIKNQSWALQVKPKAAV